MNDLYDYQNKLEKLARKFTLSNLCGCQLIEFSQEITNADPSHKERLLALVYLESLVQGFVYTYDRSNYWSYLSLIKEQQIVMSYHGGEVQFRLMLKIPEHDSNFNSDLLSDEIFRLGTELLPRWLQVYTSKFGESASDNLRRGVSADGDVSRLIIEFPFLKEPIDTTFCVEDFV